MWYGTDVFRAVLKILQRGKGIRRRIRPDTRIPGDWKAFLRVDENKEELFPYLAEQLTTIGTDHGEVVSTKHETVVFNNDRTDVADLSPCMQEEADESPYYIPLTLQDVGTFK